ncbi:hypothetical protein FH5_03341 [Priestia endophytica]|nr:hypothetical protein FH5_03341 [Priestia endophytica]
MSAYKVQVWISTSALRSPDLISSSESAPFLFYEKMQKNRLYSLQK